MATSILFHSIATLTSIILASLIMIIYNRNSVQNLSFASGAILGQGDTGHVSHFLGKTDYPAKLSEKCSMSPLTESNARKLLSNRSQQDEAPLGYVSKFESDDFYFTENEENSRKIEQQQPEQRPIEYQIDGEEKNNQDNEAFEKGEDLYSSIDDRKNLSIR